MMIVDSGLLFWATMYIRSCRFRRRSRHGRYMMTMFTTVRQNAIICSPYNYGSVGPRNACNQSIWWAQERCSYAPHIRYVSRWWEM